MEYVYGPVPSRRLGRSLGVSPIPRKACTYSCVYCQLGRTTRLTTRRRSFFQKEKILGEIAAALPKSRADYVTFAGDGEPTLCKDLGWLIRQCKARFKTPVAVITNGSLLYRPEVRAELAPADVVMPSLDAGSAALFRRINRPHPSLSYRKIVEGLLAFRKTYRGLLWIEIMLVHGLNDTSKALRDLKRILDRIQPDEVHLTVPIRPPTVKSVKVPPPSRVRAARKILGRGHLITTHESGTFGAPEPASPEHALMDTCLRHPLREEQAQQIERRLGAPGTAASLVADGTLKRVRYGGKRYLIPTKNSRDASSHPRHKERSA